MELRQLKYFVAVAEELNFRRAAEKLYIQQPPLSRQIQHLERELGVKLFHRTKKSVSLTEAGKAFLDEAKLTLAQAQRAISVVKTKSTSTLTIGFSICAFDRIIPDLIHQFRQEYPETDINLTEMSKEKQIAALLNRQIDLGFCYAPITQPELESVTILSEPLAVVLPLDHPLAQQEQIELRSLQNESFILCPQDIKPDVRQQIEQLCISAGFELKIAQEASPPEVQLRLVESGMGISLMSSGSQTRHRAKVVYRSIANFTPKLKIAAFWHRDLQSIVLDNLSGWIKKHSPLSE